ncbi:hypothetical protein [Streptomyces lavendofoliae]|nr:hypothetical protein [Streptomyces lavendofoliae]
MLHLAADDGEMRQRGDERDAVRGSTALGVVDGQALMAGTVDG